MPNSAIQAKRLREKLVRYAIDMKASRWDLRAMGLLVDDSIANPKLFANGPRQLSRGFLSRRLVSGLNR